MISSMVITRSITIMDQLVYWIGPIVGAVLAALLYHYVFAEPAEGALPRSSGGPGGRSVQATSCR